MLSRLPLIALGAALLTLLAACSSSPTGDPAGGTSGGAAAPRDVMLRQLLTQQARLWDVSYPILSRGGELCPGQARASFGFQAWTRWDIGGQYQIASMSVYRLDDHVRVVHILPASPAAEAGLRAGDVIEKISWHKIPSGQRASAAMQQILEREAAVGTPLAFHLRRGEERLAIDMVPRLQCDFAMILTESDQINAFFDQQRVYVTHGLTRFVGDDSELAAVVSHVLGHALLAHKGEKSFTEEVMERWDALQVAVMDQEDRDRLSAAGITPEARPFTPVQEIEADRLALELLSRADYPLSALPEIWRRLAEVKSGAVLLRRFSPRDARTARGDRGFGKPCARHDIRRLDPTAAVGAAAVELFRFAEIRRQPAPPPGHPNDTAPWSPGGGREGERAGADEIRTTLDGPTLRLACCDPQPSL